MKFNIISFRPPRIALVLVVSAFLIDWATPIQTLDIYSNQKLGYLLLITGFTLMMWAWLLFKKHQAAICPTAATTFLVVSGIYQFTRNPMYLGMHLMLLALSLIVGSLVFYLVTVIYIAIINCFFCPYEEGKLEEYFGDSYRTYKTSVRRWF